MKNGEQWRRARNTIEERAIHGGGFQAKSNGGFWGDSRGSQCEMRGCGGDERKREASARGWRAGESTCHREGRTLLYTRKHKQNINLKGRRSEGRERPRNQSLQERDSHKILHNKTPAMKRGTIVRGGRDRGHTITMYTVSLQSTVYRRARGARSHILTQGAFPLPLLTP